MKTAEARNLKAGDRIRYDGHDGEVIAVGPTTFTVKWADGWRDTQYRFKSGATAEMTKIERRADGYP
jgi:hypothetical protein